jgi:hypothetical protein
MALVEEINGARRTAEDQHLEHKQGGQHNQDKAAKN